MQADENKTLKVELGERSYPILIGKNLEGSLLEMKERHLSEGRKVVVVVDEGLKAANPSFCARFMADLPIFLTPPGEDTKSVRFLSGIWDFLAEQKVDRSSVVFALGGGVTGDLAGFASASFLRGISFYQVPSTLLAMVDSSVGGKTGINLVAGKNLVGAFHQPKGVFVDLNVLQSLPRREFSAGMAEVIKYGMLGNAELYGKLANRTSPLCVSSPELADVILSCCSDKARIVEEDERETSGGTGGRALLNLGHTFAHAIEAVSGYGNYLHGEAVAVGLVCALRLSLLRGGCSGLGVDNLLGLLRTYELPIALLRALPLADLMKAMTSDKKIVAGNLRFVLMREIGDSHVVSGVGSSEVEVVWKSVGAA